MRVDDVTQPLLVIGVFGQAKRPERQGGAVAVAVLGVLIGNERLRGLEVG